MKYWIQFKNGSVDAMGSDGICPLDGRLSQYNMWKEGMRKAWSLQRIKQFSGFTICKGHSYSHPIKETTVYKLTYPIVCP